MILYGFHYVVCWDSFVDLALVFMLNLWSRGGTLYFFGSSFYVEFVVYRRDSLVFCF
jgi:hypothetical protein